MLRTSGCGACNHREETRTRRVAIGFVGAPDWRYGEFALHIEWAYKGHRLAGFDALLDRYPAKQFDSPTRSTIPLLEYSRSPEPRIRELTEALSLPMPQRVRLDFEHRVYPQRRKGKASHTDLMVTSPEIAIAIEAKWTEPRDETVGSWRGNSRKRRKVLRGWFDLLERRGAGPILKRDVHNLPYQMVHRAAAACYVKDASNRWLVYLVFESTATKRFEYLTDLVGLRDALGPESSLGIALARCRIEPSLSLTGLRQRWDAGERHLHVPVLRRLRNGGLMSVRQGRVHCLTA